MWARWPQAHSYQTLIYQYLAGADLVAELNRRPPCVEADANVHTIQKNIDAIPYDASQRKRPSTCVQIPL
jgi:hypothetical protein